MTGIPPDAIIKIDYKNSLSLSVLLVNTLKKSFEDEKKVSVFNNFVFNGLACKNPTNQALFLIGDNDYIVKLLRHTFEDFFVECDTTLLTEFGGKQNNELLKIKNKRIVVCKLNPKKKINSVQFKHLTKHDNISINVDGKVYDFRLKHKLFIVTPTMPKFDNYDDAIKYRCVYVNTQNIEDKTIEKLIENDKFFDVIKTIYMSMVLNLDYDS
jgi:hypothetical protein